MPVCAYEENAMKNRNTERIACMQQARGGGIACRLPAEPIDRMPIVG